MSTQAQDMARAAVLAVQCLRRYAPGTSVTRVHVPTALATAPGPRHVTDLLVRGLSEDADGDEETHLLHVLARNAVAVVAPDVAGWDRTWGLVEHVDVAVFWAEHLVDVRDAVDEAGAPLLEGLVDSRRFDQLQDGPVTRAVVATIAGRHTRRA